MEPSDARSIVLEFASTATEREVLLEWVRDNAPGGEVANVPAADRSALASALNGGAGSDPAVTPVRVTWLPRERRGARAALLRDLVAFRNPRRPREAEQRRILRRQPDRCRVVVGEPAKVSELRARFEGGGGEGDDGELAAFVARQGTLALERAERRVIGTQYKVPHFVSEEISSSRHFRGAVARAAARLGRPVAEVSREAADCVEEMVAAQSRLAIDLWGEFGRWLSRAYTVEADREGFERLRERNRSQALVFLPSHRSYLDPLVLRSALLEQGLPPNHTLGGINVGFWPIGPIARRSGYIFIRRSFKDDEVYKLALREYMAYLMRKRFNLEWYIEGGRSRTGKLRPPRYGLLSYLVEAFREGEVDDVALVPVSIVYDQLHEVSAMAAEERGARKQAESIGWLVGYARAQGTRLGKARVQVGEPLSLREALHEESGGGTGRRNEVEKAAFEVCHRIGQVTPITPTSLVTLALLGVEDRALTLEQVQETLEPLLEYVARRALPMTGEVDLRAPRALRGTLGTLVRGNVVRRFEGGLQPVYGIRPERHLEAAFYRNASVHFFVNRAITELILVRAAEGAAAATRDQAWEEALHLRDLLKFDFFFARKRRFAEEIREELELLAPGWEERKHEPAAAWEILERAPLLLAPRVLRPFFESYQVVADLLAARHPRDPVEGKAFLDECIGLAGQYRLQGRIHSPESISKELFGAALRLASNRDLVEPGGDAKRERREAFAREIGEEVRRIARVADLAAGAAGEAAR